jgi:hypothetical protein
MARIACLILCALCESGLFVFAARATDSLYSGLLAAAAGVTIHAAAYWRGLTASEEDV